MPYSLTLTSTHHYSIIPPSLRLTTNCHILLTATSPSYSSLPPPPHCHLPLLLLTATSPSYSSLPPPPLTPHCHLLLLLLTATSSSYSSLPPPPPLTPHCHLFLLLLTATSPSYSSLPPPPLTPHCHLLLTATSSSYSSLPPPPPTPHLQQVTLPHCRSTIKKDSQSHSTLQRLAVLSQLLCHSAYCKEWTMPNVAGLVTGPCRMNATPFF